MLKNHTLGRILLADDDADDRVIFCDALSELETNITLTAFADGVELMQYLEQATELPEIVFLDLNMPKKSGVECLQEIRANDRFNKMSVAIYSTSSSSKDIDETYWRGADAYIKKPNNYADLKRVLKKVLHRKLDHLASGFNRERFLIGA